MPLRRIQAKITSCQKIICRIVNTHKDQPIHANLYERLNNGHTLAILEELCGNDRRGVWYVVNVNLDDVINGIPNNKVNAPSEDSILDDNASEPLLIA
jgi:hypothetical protein